MVRKPDATVRPALQVNSTDVEAPRSRLRAATST
jgi:hypothetical protein